jgi:hypothetical protein
MMNFAAGTSTDGVGAEIEMIGEIATVIIAHGVIAGTEIGSTAMTLRSATEAGEIVGTEMSDAQRKAQTETVAVIAHAHAHAHALVTVAKSKNHLGPVVSGTVNQQEIAIVAAVLRRAANINPLRRLN